MTLHRPALLEAAMGKFHLWVMEPAPEALLASACLPMYADPSNHGSSS